MPQISYFYGIIITMYWKDHSPPHFHASYGGDEAEILISPFGIRKGYLPAKALGLVAEWTLIHQNELIENWEKGEKLQSFNKIEPLK
jgi:hypothetical protein